MAANKARGETATRVRVGLLQLFAESFEVAGLPELRGIKPPRAKAPDPVFLLAGLKVVEAARTNETVSGSKDGTPPSATGGDAQKVG